MSYRNRLHYCKNKANRKQEPPDWHKIVAIGAEADAEIARLRTILQDRSDRAAPSAAFDDEPTVRW